MTAFAAITLQNNAAANVVFTPSQIDKDGVATWFAPGAVLDARPKATLKVTNPKAGSNVARVSARITVPVMDTVDTTKKVGDVIGTVEFVMPKQATETHRLDIRKLLDKMLLDATMTAAVQNIESIY